MLAVDAHTAHHLFHECLKGDLIRGRTVILVSHHVQLCAPGANFIVALDNGRVQFQGTRDAFTSSKVLSTLVQSGSTDPADEKEETTVPRVEEVAEKEASESTADEGSTSAAPTIVATEVKKEQKKPPRKLIEEEKRAVGRIGKDIWNAYFSACGGPLFWVAFLFSFILAALGPVFENGWLRCVILAEFLWRLVLNGIIAFGLVRLWKVKTLAALPFTSVFMPS